MAMIKKFEKLSFEDRVRLARERARAAKLLSAARCWDYIAEVFLCAAHASKTGQMAVARKMGKGGMDLVGQLDRGIMW